MTRYPNNDSVINAFLSQATLEGTNPGETLWFKGNKLYSYKSLLAIVDPSAQLLFIDNHIRSYSSTTAKQTKNLVSKNTYQTLSMPLEVNPSEVLNFYWDRIEELISKFVKARLLHTKAFHKSCIHTLLQEVEIYIDYAEVDKRTSAYKRKHQITKQLFEHQIL